MPPESTLSLLNSKSKNNLVLNEKPLINEHNLKQNLIKNN